MRWTDGPCRADVVIVGAGHGGSQAAIALRQLGFAGSVLMIGREPELPYERPPLTKDYLAGEKPSARMLVRPESFWVERGIALKLGSTVSALDPATKRLTLSHGGSVNYGALIWAAGGSARRMACLGAELPGVHAIRDKADADALLTDLAEGHRRVAIVGGGYIGLEAAAVLRKRGCEVVLLEMLDRVLGRVAGEELSRFYEAEHRRHGVDIRLSAQVEAIHGTDRVTSVCLASGEVIPCDIVVAGIGIVPSVGPLVAAGATGANGVDVDEVCRTSLPDVYAIGDCAAHASRWADGAIIRLESVQNAHDMAATVARAITGDAQPYEAVPWFWSNQYDLRLQTVGLSLGHDRTVVRGSPADRSFSVVYLKAGSVIALDCVNRTQDYVQGRKLVIARATPSPAFLQKAEVLKDLAPPTTPS